jgi:hypothetical protein
MARTKNNKKDRIYFVDDVQRIIKENAAILLEDNFSDGTKRYKVKTKSTSLLITVHPEETHDLMYSIFMRFETPTTLGNQYSGKHNYHIIGRPLRTVKEVVADYEDFLTEAMEV